MVKGNNLVPDESNACTIREGKAVPVDKAFEAWTSGSLSQMFSALDTKTNQVDRHFLLMGIVNETYRLRSDPKMAEECLKVAQMHIDEFPAIMPALKRDFDGTLPCVATFQHYATLLTERGDFEKAIKVCETAISYGLEDGTIGGFEARINRIKKKASL